MTEAAPDCPLCRGEGVGVFAEIDGKRYWRCPTCRLTFLDLAHHLSAGDEHAHYLHHENHVEDAGYRRFLSRLSQPMLARLAPGSEGLDYGCGPGPALACMLREAGHEVSLYDPFFAPDGSALARSYDFVTCTEVAEHFRDPAADFDRFARLLRPGGWLGIMTCFQTDDARFARWHYRLDPTHVVFYRQKTFEFLAERLGWSFECPAKDIALMRKPA